MGSENSIDLSSSLGLIEITLPDPSSCQLSANTSFGSIESDFELVKVSGGLGGTTASGKLGKGQAKIVLNASNGSIRIKKEKTKKSAH